MEHGASSTLLLFSSISTLPIPYSQTNESDCVWFCSGVIRTALPNMDREVKENYQVVIQAKDMAGQMGGLSGTTTVSITLSDVNDNPPRFSKSECGTLFHTHTSSTGDSRTHTHTHTYFYTHTQTPVNTFLLYFSLTRTPTWKPL